MPSIMVYTEETFYYTDGIRVVAREEYMRPDVTELSFYRKEGFWFGFEAPYSIYTMQGIRALIELKLRQYDCTPEFRYTRKKIEYSYSEKDSRFRDFLYHEIRSAGVLSRWRKLIIPLICVSGT